MKTSKSPFTTSSIILKTPNTKDKNTNHKVQIPQISQISQILVQRGIALFSPPSGNIFQENQLLIE